MHPVHAFGNFGFHELICQTELHTYTQSDSRRRSHFHHTSLGYIVVTEAVLQSGAYQAADSEPEGGEEAE